MRIAIVGPGRVGVALAMALQHAGLDVLGCVGRDPERTQQAAERSGLRALTLADLPRAHVVMFCVGDAELAQAIATAAAVGGRRCSLWLHTSGRHDLEVFAPALALGVRTGSLHPVLPFGDAPVAAERLHGVPAVLRGGASSLRLMRRLCVRLGLVAIECGAQDRALYHAGLALAANGLTALFGLAVDLVQRAGGIAAGDAATIVATLQQQALQSVQQHGAGCALSGPVRRGDAATVALHVERLGVAAPAALPAYRALMHLALRLALQQGLSAAGAAAVQAVLEAEPSRGDA